MRNNPGWFYRQEEVRRNELLRIVQSLELYQKYSMISQLRQKYTHNELQFYQIYSFQRSQI